MRKTIALLVVGGAALMLYNVAMSQNSSLLIQGGELRDCHFQASGNSIRAFVSLAGYGSVDFGRNVVSSKYLLIELTVGDSASQEMTVLNHRFGNISTAIRNPGPAISNKHEGFLLSSGSAVSSVNSKGTEIILQGNARRTISHPSESLNGSWLAFLSHGERVTDRELVVFDLLANVEVWRDSIEIGDQFALVEDGLFIQDENWNLTLVDLLTKKTIKSFALRPLLPSGFELRPSDGKLFLLSNASLVQLGVKGMIELFASFPRHDLLVANQSYIVYSELDRELHHRIYFRKLGVPFVPDDVKVDFEFPAKGFGFANASILAYWSDNKIAFIDLPSSQSVVLNGEVEFPQALMAE